MSAVPTDTLAAKVRERVAGYITALMVDDGKNVRSCEAGMDDALDALVARIAELEAALTAWWEPQRHVGDCLCQACELTRAALAAVRGDQSEGE